MVTKKRKRKVTNLLKPKIKIHVRPKHFCPSFKCKRQLTKSNLVTGKLKFPGFNSWVFWVFFKVDIVSKTWLSKFQDCQNCQKKKKFRFRKVVVVVQSPSCVWLFATTRTAACQASLSLTISRVRPSSCSLHSWCHPAISSSDALFSFCPQSFPASGTFPMSRLFTSDEQNTGVSASASVLPTSIQDWFSLRFTSLIFLLSKGLSAVFSSTTTQRHQLFGILSSFWSNSHNCTWPLERP